jgi:hypothetical protein
MTIPEIFITFKQAEETGHLSNLSNYIECTLNCASCPAGDTCRFLAYSAKNTYLNQNFNQAFDELIRPNLPEFENKSLDTLHKEYPEYLI